VAVTVREIAAWVNGPIEGDAACVIEDVRPLQEAGPGHLTFLDDDKHIAAFLKTGAAAVVAGPRVRPLDVPTIRVADPLMAFATIFRKWYPPAPVPQPGIHPTAVIDPSAEVATDVFLGPYVSIGPQAIVGPRCQLHAGVVIGARCKVKADAILHPHVVLYEDVTVGQRVIIHANAVIGADGFGYRTQNGKHLKVPQLGGVEIQDDVEIGAGSTIDRGTFANTVIGAGTKVDNLVQIGHNVRIGPHNILCSQVGIAGSCTTGSYVVFGGQSGVVEHCSIGDYSMIGAKSGLSYDVPPQSRMLGVPATPDREQMRIMMTLEKLPEMRKSLRKILQHLGMNQPTEAPPKERPERQERG
jgi:UDP-3-O-[3-hydroxymyristoyl] glucosamine N-acyltransferase